MLPCHVRAGIMIAAHISIGDRRLFPGGRAGELFEMIILPRLQFRPSESASAGDATLVEMLI